MSISCGAFHNLVLYESGNLWGWDDNRCGQLGGVPLRLVLKPRLLFSNIKQIKAADNHSLILCHDGVLFACGDNSFGQLGRFGKTYHPDPLKIETTYSEILTFNAITLGKTVEQDENETFDA